MKDNTLDARLFIPRFHPVTVLTGSPSDVAHHIWGLGLVDVDVVLRLESDAHPEHLSIISGGREQKYFATSRLVLVGNQIEVYRNEREMRAHYKPA